MEYIRMIDYCSSVRDGTHDTPKPVIDGKPLITSKAINNNEIDFKQTYNISEKDFELINKRSLVEKWDVLMTMIGSVGRMLLVKNDPDYAIKNVALFKIGDEYRAKWLYYYFNLPEVQKYIELIASGTSQHFIPLGQLRKFKIANYQPNSKRIIDILSKYDKLIENNNRRIKLLEQASQELYKEWFVRFRFPGYKNAEFENGIPKEWNIKKIGELYKTSSGGTPSRKHPEYYAGSIPWIKTGELKDGFIFETEEYINDVAINNSSAKIIKAGSLLLAMYAGSNVGNMGFTMIESTCNQACCVFGVESNNSLNYLFYFLKSQREYLQSISFGAAQQNISQDILRKMKILMPSKFLIESFDLKINAFHKEIMNLVKQNQNLIKQRDLLLPRLMSGKLEVK